MESILVGVKRPLSAGPALRWAAHYARAAGLGVRLVHVVGADLSGLPELHRDAYRYAEATLAEAADTVGTAGIGLIERIVVEGDPAEQLHTLARSAAMIVVATDGPSVPSHRGVHALRMATGAPVPVVVVPETDSAQRSGIVVGVDTHLELSDAVRFAAACAVDLSEPLTLVHAWQLPFVAGPEYEHPAALAGALGAEAVRAVRRLARAIHQERPQLVVRELVVRGDPVDVLREAAARSRLLVVGSHHRSALSRLMLGSVSHGVLVNLAAPTAIVSWQS